MPDHKPFPNLLNPPPTLYQNVGFLVCPDYGISPFEWFDWGTSPLLCQESLNAYAPLLNISEALSVKFLPTSPATYLVESKIYFPLSSNYFFESSITYYIFI